MATLAGLRLDDEVVVPLETQPRIARVQSDATNSTTTLSNVTDLVFSAAANTDYLVNAYVLFRTAATTTGLGLAVTVPNAASVTYTALVPNAADAASAAWFGWGTSSGDKVQATGVQAANTDYLASLTGIARVGANAGNVQLQFCSEVGTSLVTVRMGSILTWARTN